MSNDETLFQSVAIIGMAGRFPGAADIDAFWANLAAGVESVRRLDDAELDALGVPAELRAHPAYVPAAARLAEAEDFDAEFFDMTPREAEITDPQHRVLLECAYAAMQHAGYVPATYPGAVGVYAGVGLNSYLLHNLMPRQDLLRSLGMHQLLLGNDKCYAASRIAYKLNLDGPCIGVDTACSSSLVAVTLAYRALISFECDLALAGGAKVNAADAGYPYEPGSINSPDGHCRTFDAAAGGTVFGSGAGIVVLKRLEDALRDRDTIHAVIRGAAVNNDGAAKVGFTAPSVTRQRDVIRQALSFAEVPASSVSYVEAHGTGTRLGDPIELAALGEAFAGVAPGSVALGSVKPNIGHLESAAGVAGLIKVAQALRHGQLPPSLNYATPNPAIDFVTSPFCVNTALRPWPAGATPRRAGVSSFGLGGTNAHVVVEEAPAAPPAAPGGPELLVWSARTPAALERLSTRLAAHAAAADGGTADAAYTLACGREHFAHRRFAVGGSWPEIAAALAAPAMATAAAAAPRVAFVFPGQGVQRAGMAGPLYRSQPVYRAAIDACCAALGAEGAALLPLLLQEGDDATLQRTEWAQPAIFATSYAMARLWQSWGVQPAVLLGHSLGEYVAACVAGVFAAGDAIRLVAARAGLMQAQPEGAMAALRLSGAEAAALLAAHPEWECDLAAENGPRAVAVAGSHAGVAQCLAAVRAAGGDGQPLRTSHAFHSRRLDGMLDAYGQVLRGVRGAPARMPLVSCLTGRVEVPERWLDPGYWLEQTRGTVRFGAAVAAAAPLADVFIDMGPGATAAALVQGALPAPGHAAVLAAAPTQGGDAMTAVLQALGAAWVRGATVDWTSVYAERTCRRVPLPGYPFERRRCWVDAPGATATLPAPAAVAPVAASVAVASAEPADALQAQVAAVWCELLGSAHIGPDESFFALGGQSLLATRIISRLHEVTGIELPVQAIYETPTIAGLTQALLAQQAAAADPEMLERLLAELEAGAAPAAEGALA
ncbi:acyl transferase domain-containing protein [Pseudoduganella flava]|nr:acyl transferase domain-containing protein [Pseudoduganella flava]